METGQALNGNAIIWAKFLWESLGPGVSLTCTTPIVAEQVHPFTTKCLG